MVILVILCQEIILSKIYQRYIKHKKYKYSARLPYGEEITNSICEYCGFKK